MARARVAPTVLCIRILLSHFSFLISTFILTTIVAFALTQPTLRSLSPVAIPSAQVTLPVFIVRVRLSPAVQTALASAPAKPVLLCQARHLRYPLQRVRLLLVLPFLCGHHLGHLVRELYASYYLLANQYLIYI